MNASMRLTNDPEINKQIGAQLKPALKKSPDLEPRIAEAFWAVLSRPVREEDGICSGLALGAATIGPMPVCSRWFGCCPTARNSGSDIDFDKAVSIHAFAPSACRQRASILFLGSRIPVLEGHGRVLNRYSHDWFRVFHMTNRCTGG